MAGTARGTHSQDTQDRATRTAEDKCAKKAQTTGPGSGMEWGPGLPRLPWPVPSNKGMLIK